STNMFGMSGGILDQPSGADLTVTGTFWWTAGKLNSTANLANVTITGEYATATIAPANGVTVNLGSNLSLMNGAFATMKEGTVEVNKSGIAFTTNGGSSFNIDPGALKKAIIGVQSALLP